MSDAARKEKASGEEKGSKDSSGASPSEVSSTLPASHDLTEATMREGWGGSQAISDLRSARTVDAAKGTGESASEDEKEASPPPKRQVVAYFEA